ncbi:MAG: DUF4347 domain-containing protein, partial [Gammaproteobacteria bacterium]
MARRRTDKPETPDRDKRRKKADARRKSGEQQTGLEELEPRILLSTFTVANTDDAGEGSLRQAILDANTQAGADVIEFQVDAADADRSSGSAPTETPDARTTTGTDPDDPAASQDYYSIRLSSVLPEVTDTVSIDARTQLRADGTSGIEIDGRLVAGAGLRFGSGSDGSSVDGISFSHFGANAVEVDGSGSVTLDGNLFSAEATTVLSESETVTAVLPADGSSSDIVLGNLADTTTEVTEEVRHELIFVDQGVEDFDALLIDLLNADDSTARQVEVVLISPDRDGISQISEALAGRQDLDAVHFIAHGGDGEVQLGDTTLDASALQSRQSEIEGWANALDEDADFLFYGCELAATDAGKELVSSLAELTSTDISASDDLTGSAALGGDWDLEYSVGSVETAAALTADGQQTWRGVLATITGTAGDDVLASGAGNDVIDGLAGYDTVDYSAAASAVTVDLTITTAQDTGGAGFDTFSSIEGAIGSTYDDTFVFSSPQDGAVYTVDGNTGSNTIDLSSYSSSDATFGDGVMTIDMGGGQSFTIAYTGVETIAFSDLSATVLSASMTQAGFSGTGIWIDGAEAFKVDVAGAGTLDLAYSVGSDRLSVTGSTGVDATSSLAITDLNGTDLLVDQIILDDSFGDLTTNIGVGNIGLAGVSSDIHGTFTIGGDLGSIDMHALAGTLDVQGVAGTIHIVNDLEDGALLNVTGDVTTLQVDDDIGGTV